MRDDGRSIEEKIAALEGELEPFWEAEGRDSEAAAEIHAELQRDEHMPEQQELMEEAEQRRIPLDLLLKERQLESLRRQRENRRKAIEAREQELIQLRNEAFETARTPLQSLLSMRWDPPQAVRRTLFWGASSILGGVAALTVADRIPENSAQLAMTISGLALASVVISLASHAIVSRNHVQAIQTVRQRIDAGKPLTDDEVLTLGEGGRTLALEWGLISFQAAPILVALAFLSRLVYRILEQSS